MAAISWSNPNAGEAQTPAALQAHYQYSAPNVSGVLGELMKQRQIDEQQQLQQAQTAIKGAADYVQKRKNDQIAQQFLDQASQYDSDNPDATAQIARNLNESNAGPSDAWKAFQSYQQNKIKTDLEQAHANYFNRFSSAPQSPTVDPTTGMTWNGRQWVKGGSAGKTPLSKFGSPDLSNVDFNSMDLQDERGNPITDETIAASKIPENKVFVVGNDAQGQPFRVPRSTLRQAFPKPASQSQPPAASQTTPSGAPPVGTVKGGYRFKGGDPADQNNWEKL